MRRGSATAFERLVDDYDAARPTYPAELYAALPAVAGRDVLELGAGTGLATAGLRDARLVLSDLGPNMLRRAVEKTGLPAVVARAEALPFADAAFDLVCGAQMWHWVDVPAASAEAARVLRPGGALAVWWNELDAAGERWFQDQQDRLEAADPAYTRTYRQRPYADELRATGLFSSVASWEGRWSRELDWPLYARWLRSKSYVAQLDDPEAFLAAEQASLAEAFPDGRIVEPFRVQLHVATVSA